MGQTLSIMQLQRNHDKLFSSWINYHPSCLLITQCFPQHLKAANKVKIDTYQNLIVHNFAISRHWNTVTRTKNWMFKVFVLVEASKRFFFSRCCISSTCLGRLSLIAPSSRGSVRAERTCVWERPTKDHSPAQSSKTTKPPLSGQGDLVTLTNWWTSFAQLLYRWLSSEILQSKFCK